MADRVTAYYVMIASPSDIPDARRAVYDALIEWNEANAHTRHAAFVPLKWETGAVPTLGKHPQAIINDQLLSRADIVIGLFGSRLGKPTEDELSGTVEEVRKADAAGTPVHLYFSEAPHPNDVDPDQLKALHQFRDELAGQPDSSRLRRNSSIWCGRGSEFRSAVSRRARRRIGWRLDTACRALRGPAWQRSATEGRQPWPAEIRNEAMG